ncbi:MAG: hypothetical protein Q4G06_10150, partial [Clostridia bacterium]|nr:hypothetical protein [Clostridia bacterium]
MKQRCLAVLLAIMILFVAHAPKIVDVFATDTVPEAEQTAMESAAEVETAPAPVALSEEQEGTSAPATPEPTEIATAAPESTEMNELALVDTVEATAEPTPEPTATSESTPTATQEPTE